MSQKINQVAAVIETDGTGDKYLSDDGTYKEVSVGSSNVDLSNYYDKEETNELLDNKLDKFYVNYNINPETMEIISISHYSEEIINAHNEGKQVIFMGNILGLNIPMISYLSLIEGDIARSFATFKFDLGDGMMSLLSTIEVLPSEVYLEVTQLAEETGESNEFYDVYYDISITAYGISIDRITHSIEEIINAYNERKQVRFIGFAYGRAIHIVSYLNLVQDNTVYSFPTKKVDLGQGLKNYAFKLTIDSNGAELEVTELVDMEWLKKQYYVTYEQFTSELNASLDGVILNHMALEPHLPRNAPEGAIIKYINGKWETVEDNGGNSGGDNLEEKPLLITYDTGTTETLRLAVLKEGASLDGELTEKQVLITYEDGTTETLRLVVYK